jgi:endonuclease/exonuclease/phosphatase (EEP) superfamily protein YafD
MLTEHYDVVALVELTPATADLLSASLAKDFPHAALHPDNSPFGLGIWSRAPILDHELRPEQGLSTASLQVRLADASKTELLLLHPVPPLGAAFSQARDRQIAQVAEQVAGRDLIILGDFNASPWSHSMRALTASGFKHAGAGWTRWPTWYGRSMLFAVPIDHVYLPGNWQTLDYRVGPDIGSDHRPLSVLLQRLE